MTELEGTMEARPATPTAGSSFCNDVFDFEAFEEIDVEMIPISASGSAAERSTISATTPSSAPKRLLSLSPEKTEVKHRRVTKDLPGAEVSSVPSWVREFDSELIAGLEDYVEFVD